VTLLHVSLLGGFECRSADGAVLCFSIRKVRALFAYLVATATRSHGRS
jgi:DNA-binding SARP family transcriptional activator